MIKNRTAESQIEEMKRLINFGVNESKQEKNVPVVEIKKKAANGKTYGIIREASKYYVMEAPQKDTEVLAEDFDYIGGFNNRKENEYSSYAKASNALDLKLMSINEAVDKSKRVIIEKPVEKAEWETCITESMRAEIDRFKTITTNAKRILKEEKGDIIPSAHTLPEAPAKNPSDDKVNAPYTDTAVAKGDKDFKEKSNDHVKVGKPFNTDGEATSKDMQSDKNPKSSEDGDAYTEKPQYVDTGVGGQHPSGGKVVRVNETKKEKKRVKLTLEQVLAWNKNKDYLDMSNGTEIGSSDPYEEEVGEESNQTEAPTEPIHESEGDSVVYDHPTDQNKPTPGTNEVGDGQPFDNEVNEEVTIPSEEAAGLPDDGEDFSDYPFPEDAEETYGERFDREWNDFENAEDDNQVTLTVDDDDDYVDDFGDLYLGDADLDLDINSVDESFDKDDELIFEVKMDYWGKHPAYRKKPMTLPPNKEVAINGARDWNDSSVEGEEPFGKQIGDGAPYEDIVDAVTESVYRILKKKG